MGLLAELEAHELAKLTEEGKIETNGRLKIYYYDVGTPSGTNLPAVKVWRGRAKKPYANYRFKSDELRDQFIERQIEEEQSKIAYEEEQKARRKQQTTEMQNMIQVGTLLHCSWGYEQTQCDFYQVVEKKARSVVIRPIASRIVTNSEGFMSDRRKPDRGHFLEGSQGKPITKRIGPYGISMDHGIATPCDDESSFYCSWYH